MAETTKIEWCDATVNFWWGCTRVSPACDHCYAEELARRFGGPAWGQGEPRKPRLEAAAKEAFRLNRRAAKEGRRLKVFSNSMADFFDSEVPDAWRDHAMAVIALTPHLDWLVLTKRPKVMREYLQALGDGWVGQAPSADSTAGRFQQALWQQAQVLDFGRCATEALNLPFPLPNLWLGVTAENQKMADLRIPELLATPAARRFVSCEPLLGPVDLGAIEVSLGDFIDALYCDTHPEDCENDPYRAATLDWVIAGGESGRQARPTHPDWLRGLRDDCLAAGVPFFFKQWGEWAPRSCDDPDVFGVDFGEFHGGADFIVGCCCREGDAESAMFRVGKKYAGRVLDGAIWDQFPSSETPAPSHRPAGAEAGEGAPGDPA